MGIYQASFHKVTYRQGCFYYNATNGSVSRAAGLKVTEPSLEIFLYAISLFILDSSSGHLQAFEAKFVRKL